MFSEVSVSHSAHRGGGVLCVELVQLEVILGNRAKGEEPDVVLPPGGLPNPHPTDTSGGHCSGRYTSYWNAFLYFCILLNISLFPEHFKI